MKLCRGASGDPIMQTNLDQINTKNLQKFSSSLKSKFSKSYWMNVKEFKTLLLVS